MTPTRTHARPRTPTRSTTLLGEVGRFGLSWFGALIPLAFVTQLFAGSSFSPGQGGGFSELLTWVIVFGLITMAIVAERHLHTRRGDLVHLARAGARYGFLGGVIIAVIWFSAKGGPEPGNWFVGPACAASGAATLLYTVTTQRR